MSRFGQQADLLRSHKNGIGTFGPEKPLILESALIAG